MYQPWAQSMEGIFRLSNVNVNETTVHLIIKIMSIGRSGDHIFRGTILSASKHHPQLWPFIISTELNPLYNPIYNHLYLVNGHNCTNVRCCAPCEADSCLPIVFVAGSCSECLEKTCTKDHNMAGIPSSTSSWWSAGNDSTGGHEGHGDVSMLSKRVSNMQSTWKSLKSPCVQISPVESPGNTFHSIFSHRVTMTLPSMPQFHCFVWLS